MGLVSPIPTYIINIFFAHFQINKNHRASIPYTDLYYQYSFFYIFSIPRPTYIINEVFCTFLMYPRDREMTFMT